jgi:hypothetical protein
MAQKGGTEIENSALSKLKRTIDSDDREAEANNTDWKEE